MSCITLPGLNFSLVTNNDDMIQMNVDKKSSCLPASIQSAQWEMFAPGTRTAILTKNGSDIIIIDRTINGILWPASAFKFMIEKEDTVNLDLGYYPHEATIITTDGRVHTVTQGDILLMAGQVYIRDQYTPPPVI